MYSYKQIVSEWGTFQNTESVFDGHFLINFVSQSSQIENIDVDYNTTREIFESERVSGYSGDLRDVFSVMNNRRVAAFVRAALKRNAPISSDFIKEVHHLLMFACMDTRRYEVNGERAGEFKKKDYCVGRLSVGSLPEDVAADIEELCKLLAECAGKEPLRAATVLQCQFEYIRPFADGNGRTGRWLTNYLLVKSGHPPVLFEREERKRYYEALEAYDRSEDYMPMYNYLQRQTVKSWDAVRRTVNVSAVGDLNF